jgi:hypothetical protein
MNEYDRSSGTAGMTTDNVATNETDRLIASDRVEGTAVFDRTGERLGTVHNFMVDKHSGKVAYAVMSFGGFLGIGERYHPLPWKKLDYDTSLGGYVVDTDRRQLEDAPHYSGDENPWSGSDYGRGVYGYWGVPYYM